MIKALTPDASLTLIEEEVRRFWQRHGVVEAALGQHPGGPAYTIAQQPLAAAGQPPAEQVALLASSDLLARFRRMRGERVYHQVGWSGHGLAVEVAVEQALGPELQRYDLAGFNAACQAAAVDGVRRGEALAERLAVWHARRLDDVYVTLAPQAVEKVWAALKRLWEAGLLRCEQAVVPFCPRCVTPLSAGEAARRAVESEAQVAWLSLPWLEEPNGYLLAWTPSPWMLIGLAGLAAHPRAEYVVVEVPRGKSVPPARLLLAEGAVERAIRGEHRIVRRLAGRSLRGAHYRPLFTFLPTQSGASPVILSESVPADQGSGLMPLTPAFDAASLAMAAAHSIPWPAVTDETGRLNDAVTPWRGLPPLEAERLLVQDLQARGLIFRRASAGRAQAVCPYCATPLLPLARPVWLAGRWIVSRERAWGAPLPIWQCTDCGQAVCVGGLSDLAGRAGIEPAQVELYRPAIDRLAFPCQACGGAMRRLAPVLDAGFEAAVLPGAFAPRPGPADVAVGCGDREMGWLGDVGEIAELLHGALAWNSAVTVPTGGGSPDEAEGLARPEPADALRWAAYTRPEPGTESAASAFLRQAWALVFPHADVAGMPGPGEGWLRVRLLQGSARIGDALESADVARAAEELALLIQDMQGWFKAGQGAVPAEVLATLSRLMAPFVPHLAEAIFQRAGRPAAASVHLAAWPDGDPRSA